MLRCYCILWVLACSYALIHPPIAGHTARTTAGLTCLHGYTKRPDVDGAKKRPAPKPKAKPSPAPFSAAASSSPKSNPLKPPPKSESLEKLELQVLSKYGSNAFKAVLEEGWDEDEDDEPASRNRNPRPNPTPSAEKSEKSEKKANKALKKAQAGPLAQFGMLGRGERDSRFGGFGSQPASAAGLAATVAAARGVSELSADDFFADGEEEGAEEVDKSRGSSSRGGGGEGVMVAVRGEDVAHKRAGTLLGGRLGRRLAPDASQSAATRDPGAKPMVSAAAAAAAAEVKAARPTVQGLLESYEGEEEEEEEGEGENGFGRRDKSRWPRGTDANPTPNPNTQPLGAASRRWSANPNAIDPTGTLLYRPPVSSPASPAPTTPAPPSWRLRPPPPKSPAKLEEEVRTAARLVAEEEERRRKKVRS